MTSSTKKATEGNEYYNLDSFYIAWRLQSAFQRRSFNIDCLDRLNVSPKSISNGKATYCQLLFASNQRNRNWLLLIIALQLTDPGWVMRVGIGVNYGFPQFMGMSEPHFTPLNTCNGLLRHFTSGKFPSACRRASCAISHPWI